MLRRLSLLALAAWISLAPSRARAESTGTIDWQHRTIQAHGQGAPDLNAPSISAARLGAERAAKADALRNLLETLQGVQLSSGDKLGTLLQSDSALRARVEGTLRAFRVVSPHYYADGGVGLEVEVDLDKLPPELVKQLAQDHGAPASSAPGPAALPAPTQEAGATPAQAAQPSALSGAGDVLQARGEGRPDPSAASIAAARLGAERAARIDAVRALLAALQSIGGADAVRDAALGAKVDGALRGYFVSKVHYYSDGGVALDVELPLAQLPAELRAKLHAAAPAR